MDQENLSPRKAALLVLAKMSMCDGTLSAEERDLLEELLEDDPDTHLDALLLQVKDLGLEALVSKIKSYPDRFFIALRAYAMAHVDAHFDVAEAALFEHLAGLLQITPEDMALIAATESEVEEALEEIHAPRLAELYEASSFSRS